MKENTIIVVATDEEYDLAVVRFKNHKIIQTGIGGLNVIKTLRNLPKDTPILNFGYVGSNNIEIGSEVKINKVKLYHPNVTYDEPQYNLINGDTSCYTSNDFVLSTDIKEPIVFDMELAYIMALGFNDVQSIKIVSDNLNLNEYEKNIK